MKGTDERMYVFDLMHMMPRDTNFAEDDHAVLRANLLNAFYLHKAEAYVTVRATCCVLCER